jgi:DNA repair protein RadA/Sms
MTPKSVTRYVCGECGYASLSWLGKCPECGTWESLAEEIAPSKSTGRRPASLPRESPVSLSGHVATQGGRLETGISEFDSLLGGGVVRGSFILIGGEPGIGKSTLMLQACEALAGRGHRVLYISGEESTAQTKMRAERVGAVSDNLYIVCETDMDVIAGHVEELEPDVLVVDSIQIVYSPKLESAPGSVSQVRESAAQLMFTAKGKGCVVFIIGHVTKSGAIAGPRVLEHMVDTVLYFEGDRFHLCRILRAVKNRFGSTDEIAIFQMTERGLEEVGNPSSMFIGERRSNVPGSIVAPILEGTRPLLVEVQSLVSPTSFGLPVRRTSGVDVNRLSMILAVLQRRVGLSLGDKDVYVNVVGGMRITEPAVDLGVAIAAASSLRDRPASPTTAVFGEVGL